MKSFLLSITILLVFTTALHAQDRVSKVDVYDVKDPLSQNSFPESKVLGQPFMQKGPVYDNSFEESLTPSEGFESATFPPTGWTWYVINGATTQRWLRSTSTTSGLGAYGLSFSSAFFNSFNAANGVVQALQSPTFTPTVGGEVLKFDWLYQPYSGSQTPLATDSLVVQTSTDGGTTWNDLIIMWGDSTSANYFNNQHLITGVRTTASAQNDVSWATKILTLPVGTNCIRFKGHSQFGNNIYIDNIDTYVPTPSYAGGTYTINPSNPPSATNWQTFRAAADSLNKRGISGNVTINVSPGVYGAGNRFYLIPMGSSVTNKVTFQKSGTGMVVIADTGTASTTDYAVLVDGPDWVTLDGIDVRDMSFGVNGQMNRGYVVDPYRSLDGSRNVTIKNCNIVLGGTLNPAAGALGISVGGMNGGATFPTIQDGSADSMKIQSVRVNKVDRGIQLTVPIVTTPQSVNAWHRNIEISGCVLGDSLAIGSLTTPNPIAYLLNGVKDLNMFGNRVDSCRNSVTTSTAAVVGTLLQFTSGRMYNNVIRNLSHANLASTAALLTGIQGGANNGENLYIYNNLLYNLVRSYTGTATVTVLLKGIEVTNFTTGALATTTNHAYNNTILIDSTAAPVTFTSTGINVFGSGLPNFVRNNNVINRLSTTALPAKSLAIADANTTRTPLNSNYNNFFVTGINGFVGAFGASLVTNNATIADWKTGSTGDTNSVSNNVVHSSLFPLTVDPSVAGNWVLNGKGIALSLVTTDINGVSRNTLVTQGTTDIGADEVTMSVNPSFATESAAPSSGGTSIYMQFGDTVCIVNWGTGGTLPSTLNILNFSGNTPPNSGTKHYLMSYLNAVPTGTLSGTTYDMTMKYGYNEAFNITNIATDLRMAKQDGNVWTTYTTAGTGNLETELNDAGRRMTIRGLSTLSNFTGSDITLPLNTLGLGPVLNTPPNNSINYPVSFTFRWFKSVEQTTSVISKYWFQLHTDTNSAPVQLDSSLVDTMKVATGLANNTTYFWKVRAKNENGWGPFSGYFKFTTIVSLPAAPTLVAPANNATGVSLAPLFDWSDVTDNELEAYLKSTDNTKSQGTVERGSPQGYRIQISADSTFTTTVKDTSGITPSQYQIPGGLLTNNTRYYWRVRKTNAAGDGPYSTRFTFLTAPLGPAVVNFTVIPGGLYNTSTGRLNRRDTVKVILVDSTNCLKVDSAKGVIDSVTFGMQLNFGNVTTGNYYIFVYHRNHVAMASKFEQSIVRGSSVSYNFTTDSAKAFGNNMIKVSTSPVRWAMIPGDANRDGFVDGLDQTAWVLLNGFDGYLQPDFNGDGFVDGLDQTIWIIQNGMSFVLPCNILDNVMTLKDFQRDVKAPVYPVRTEEKNNKNLK